MQAYGRLSDSLTEDGYDVRAVVLSSVFQRLLLLDWTRIVRIHCIFKVIHIDCGSSTTASALLVGGEGSRDNGRVSLQNWEEMHALQYAVVVAPDRAPFPVIAAVHGHVIGAASNSVKMGELNVNHLVELADDSEQAFKALKPGFFFTYNNIGWD